VLLAEVFIADMDSSLRQIGIGDYVVGKHVGRMMGALGGRLAAFREAGPAGDFAAAVRRNIFHDAPPSEDAPALVSARLERFAKRLGEISADDLLAGRLGTPRAREK
jgi:cytochrome b pre-mRNA-processing protein 3